MNAGSCLVKYYKGQIKYRALYYSNATRSPSVTVDGKQRIGFSISCSIKSVNAKVWGLLPLFTLMMGRAGAVIHCIHLYMHLMNIKSIKWSGDQRRTPCFVQIHFGKLVGRKKKKAHDRFYCGERFVRVVAFLAGEDERFAILWLQWMIMKSSP